MSETYFTREHAGQGPDAPTLVLLHGTGGDENQFFNLGRQLLPRARIVAIRGDVSEGGALRYFRRTGEGVYDMDDLAVRTEKMAGFLKGLASDGPLIGLGYSNGANILASVMMAHPDLIDAGVLMHPLIPWEPEPVEGLAGRRVLITAGRRDPICPAPLTQSLADWFVGQGAATEIVWHEGGHEIVQSELAAVAGFLGGHNHG
ncbi:alpha/beta hydrolase [Pelagibacterium halotolerans]|uniref:Carboxylesterase n=1 Tax=Pelagibacterium halotolerans (strain DSM 22347 / JCM 15775 / CGMCC 1.7692 / B2) TaxID=1082931 RepID=G4RCX0_PELHB|nr:alpha/beta hydrolase [Pelagibacterium halotolerans]AEQ52753.1 Carboxylesterase [Pelagibacterium halotolerans B2]QJR17549.1 alpha/beta hydrolase [Pelagibacterium halotolerans]SEA76834.1 phospholipase/carboxylesterase [Pelagibacterium halotolerans]